ncbi:sigma-70 family RNA polymerase sigma factor [Phenylobacterium sp. J367]|uniref:sigma-70 family RNA polymerase sigma factor n=1 Tax=Phenylobacterium sp. J367 TaxID=2898435 RepID=UPI0021507C62|nr:sigma-70 family RNA polymerase sigma factor [Phenylobacterium sp. J367]MCR5878154.1 sigma-70 family RNA polymerase sigma factor [Phenylobacterium sp. J367]
MSRKSESLDVVQHLPQMLRYARALVRDASAAEDLVQSALERAHARRATFRDGADLRAWLLAILHNAFVSAERSRRAAAARDAAAARTAPVAAEPVQEHAADLQLVQAAFRRLSPEHRAVLHLVAVEGLSYPVAAAALEIPVGTVMSRLSRARAALRAELGGAEAPARPRLRLVGGEDDR